MEQLAKPLRVIGIGASAGGLKAIQAFFSHIPADTGFAFVVIQHLSPDFKSLMPELLARHTTLPIRIADHGEQMQPNTIYLNKSRINLRVERDELHFTEKGLDKAFNMPIDIFFHSLGAAYKDKSIAVVLSGTGSDGSRGVRTVKEAGGLIYAQDPETCQFDDMPKYAIQSRAVDFILSPGDISKSIIRISSLNSKVEPEPLTSEEHFHNILMEVQKFHGVDFKYYKKNTLERRIEKRMNINGCTSYKDYLKLLKKSGDEHEMLYQDLLICVTSFFRDPEAFEVLQLEVLPVLCKEPNSSLRLWVSGCATGEEAYTLAIMLDDYIERHHLAIDFKIFATDIFLPSIEKASLGIYNINIESEIAPNLYSKYFSQTGGKVKISKRIRNKIVFSVHDILRDPPFINIDFISCRNLLIYLQPVAQQKVKKNMQFSLRKGGFIFLGAGESLGSDESKFSKINTKWKIWQYMKESNKESATPGSFSHLSNTKRTMPKPGFSNTSHPRHNLELSYYKYISEYYAPAILFVDAALNILFVKGDLSEKLRLKEGIFEQNVSNLANVRLVALLRNGVRKVQSNSEQVMIKGVAFDGKDERVVDLTFRKVKLPSYEEHIFAIEFTGDRAEEATIIFDKDEIGDEAAQRIIDLEHELKEKEEELDSALMIQEASNEELQSTNEELKSSNEELQSTNEELQSVNEELYSVNSEMQQANQELLRAHDDIKNLFNATDIATLFLNKELRIRKFTPSFKRVLHLHESDIGRPFSDFALKFDEETRQFIDKQILQALEHQNSIKKEISDADDTFYMVKINPFLNHKGQVDGVVISFVDITNLRATQQQLLDAEQRLQQLFNVLPNGIIRGRLLYDEAGQPYDFVYVDANSTGEELLGLKDIKGKTMTELFPDLGDVKEVWLSRVVNTAQHGKSQILEEYYPQFNKHFLSHMFSPEEGEFASIFTDVTSLKKAESELDKSNKRLNLAIDLTDTAVWEWDIHGDEIINQNDTWAEIYEMTLKEVSSQFIDRLHEKDKERVWGAVREHLEGKTEKYNLEFRLWNPDRSYYKWIMNIGQVYERNELGDPEKLLGVTKDITSEKEAILNLERERKFNLSITQNSTSGIYVYDVKSGTNTYTNQRYEEILGWTQEEIDGMKEEEFFGLFHPDDSQRIISHMDQVVNKKQLSAIKYRFKTKAGHYVTCYSVDSPFEYDEAGNLISFLGTFVDITELDEAEKALIEAKDKAIQANQLKDIFLSNISHEIRTPMNAVIGFSKLLKQAELSNDKKAVYLDQINENSKALLRLIDDLLEISRLRSGEVHLTMEQFNLKKLVTDVLAFHQKWIEDHADTKLLKIVWDDSQIDDSQEICADSVRLKQVLNNLINNAIKYSDEGEINIKYHLADERVHFTVADQGIGIDEKMKATIFDRFVRGGKSVEHHQGVGLGLAICEEIVEKMGGEINMTSVPGEGTTFSFWIPSADSSLIENTSNVHTTAQFEKVNKILFVDDSPSVHLYFDGVLDGYDIAITHAYDGKEALEILNTNQDFDLILLDIQMQQMDGEETLENIKGMKLDIPVVAQTAFAMHSEVKKYLNLGFADVLTKPIDADKLFIMLGLNPE